MNSIGGIVEGDHGSHVDAAWLSHKASLQEQHCKDRGWYLSGLRQRRKMELVEAGEIDW